MMLQQFRQDSWQWDALHAGRLTTSKAASCLGFYEEHAGKKLGVPRSLRGHMKALNAWRDLCEPPCSLSAFAGEHHRQQRLHKQQCWHQQQCLPFYRCWQGRVQLCIEDETVRLGFSLEIACPRSSP